LTATNDGMQETKKTSDLLLPGASVSLLLTLLLFYYFVVIQPFQLFLHVTYTSLILITLSIRPTAFTIFTKFDFILNQSLFF